MDRAREAFWQSAWSRAGLARARRDDRKERFFAIWTYPTTSGFLHLGHLRGVTYGDVLHRYYRMRGRSVFFPNGAHASGLPTVTFAQRVKDRDPTIVGQLREQGVPEDRWSALEEPENAARFLGENYRDVFRSLGVLLDEAAYVTTIDEDYQAFIRWQFRRLQEHGVLVQQPHFSSVCPVCGPVSVDPSETDLSSGGDAESISYTTLPFRLPDGRTLLAATLRAETVYGATNLWIHPDAPLVVWHLGDAELLATRPGAERLVEQHGGHIGREVAAAALIGSVVRAPLTQADLPILPSPLVDPSQGTGVVMSVPAHAPADWLALSELQPPWNARVGFPPPVVVVITEPERLSTSERELLAGSGVPAERASRAAGANRLADAEALRAATERLYRLEFVHGRMRPDLLGGVTVPRARESVSAAVRELGNAPEIQEFSKPVVCRNGHAVVIRRIPDQWFIAYSDPAWRSRTKAMAERLDIHPPEYGREFPAILEWFGNRPCTRRGRWLGTPFPLDPSWVIEPIADSTFYPAYYVVRPFVASGRVPVSALTDAFFDFVFLGRGAGEPSLEAAVQREIQEEFRYWYPLDLNIGGKEHKRVHFPVFVATHALLLPDEQQPRGLFVHGWLTQPGGLKISKKYVGKGGAIPPLREGIAEWGADALRLLYAQSANPEQDIEWEEGLPNSYAQRLLEVERLAREMAVDGSGGPPELDAWLDSALHDEVKSIHADYQERAIRRAAERVYVRIPAIVRRYLVRGGSPGPALSRARGLWIRLMSPITPHLAEELGQGIFEGLTAVQRFPEPDDLPRSGPVVRAEEYLERVEEDLRAVLRLADQRGEAPDAVTFFVAEPWKRVVERWMRELGRGRTQLPVREIMERAKTHPELSAHLADIPGYLQRVAPLMRSEPELSEEGLPELSVLRGAEGYLARRHGFERVLVVPETEGEAHDPKGRRERARPERPAFYLSGHRAVRATGP